MEDISSFEREPRQRAASLGVWPARGSVAFALIFLLLFVSRQKKATAAAVKETGNQAKAIRY